MLRIKWTSFPEKTKKTQVAAARVNSQRVPRRAMLTRNGRNSVNKCWVFHWDKRSRIAHALTESRCRQWCVPAWTMWHPMVFLLWHFLRDNFLNYFSKFFKVFRWKVFTEFHHQNPDWMNWKPWQIPANKMKLFFRLIFFYKLKQCVYFFFLSVFINNFCYIIIGRTWGRRSIKAFSPSITGTHSHNGTPKAIRGGGI